MTGSKQRPTSFSPYQWWDATSEQLQEASRPEVDMNEVEIMWVYRRIENEYEVGFFGPDGTWFPDERYDSREGAAARCNFLNGGCG